MTIRWWAPLLVVVAVLMLSGLVMAGGDLGSNHVRDGEAPVAEAMTTEQATATATVKPTRAKAKTPTPTPTPKPTALPKTTKRPKALSEQWAGWILFWSTQEVDFFEDPTLWVMKPDGSQRQKFPDDPDFYWRMKETCTFSPDRNYRVYVGEDLQLHIFFHQDRTHWPFSELLGAIAYDPQWSPDGGWIAFVTNNDGNDEIYVKRQDRSEQRRLTFNTWEWDKHPTWSPDGTQIAFWSNRSGHNQIWIMNADGSQAHNASNSPYDDVDPVWVRRVE